MLLALSMTLFTGAAHAQCEPADVPLPQARAEGARIRAADAARFLKQATFGATQEQISAVVATGYAAWIDQQVALPASSHRAFFDARLASYGDNPRTTRQNGWWELAVTAPDQLRQRLAFALSQIFVVSESNAGLNRADGGLATYYDVLVDGAFGPYRELLERVTLSPAMGRYLSMLGNPKPDAVSGVRADENYARELMQLFSIGLVRLHPGGRPILGPDARPVPTYQQQDVEDLARALTGWSFADATVLNPRSGNFDVPMRVLRAGGAGAGPGDFHDTEAKTLLGGVVLPPGQSAEQDLAAALDLLAAHPNVAPFIGRQLIQRLVTSNPTPGYVARVSQVFRASAGHLGTVVKAILLDPEARQGPSYLGARYGKVREPLLTVTHLWRAFGARPSGNNGQAGFNFPNAERSLGQAPYRSPSVFNFFLPDYQPPFARRGVATATGCMRAPELQLVDESSEPTLSAFLSESTRRFAGPGGEPRDAVHNLRLSFDRQTRLLARRDTRAMLNDLDVLLMGGQMTPEFIDEVQRYVEADVVVSDSPGLRVAKAVYMILSSPQYRIQR